MTGFFAAFGALGSAPVPDTVQSGSGIVQVVLEWLFGITRAVGLPSYVLAIFVFTLLVTIVLLPVQLKQMRSMRIMTKLQPKIKALQARYKNNPQKVQEETLKLYRSMKANPLSGCLPLLVQIPIVWILFSGMRNFIPSAPEYFNFMWIDNLALKDPSGFILPLLVAASTFIQQYISVANKKDKTQMIMMVAMPVMLFVFSRNYASALLFYWIFYGGLSGVRQFVFNMKFRRQDREEAEEEARLEAEKAARKKSKGVIAEEAAYDELYDGDEDIIPPPPPSKWAPPGSEEAVKQAEAEEEYLKKLAAARRARERADDETSK